MDGRLPSSDHPAPRRPGGHRRLGQLLLAAAAYAVTGAAATVLVAWLLALRAGTDGDGSRYESFAEGGWLSGVDATQRRAVTILFHAGPGCARAAAGSFGDASAEGLSTLSRSVLDRLPPWAAGVLAEPPPDQVPHWEIVDARGWPLLAMRSDLSSDGTAPPAVTVRHGIGLRAGYATVDELLEARFLPTLPIPTGFLLDTAFFGTIAALAHQVPRWARRRYRRRRGQCEQCGHHLRSPGCCPECGRASFDGADVGRAGRLCASLCGAS